MNGEILKNILVIVGTWITAIITYKLTSKNDKSKLLSTQFKQQGIEKQKKLLELWTICAQNGYESFILSLESEYDKKHRLEDKIELIKLYMNDVVLYTSKETMRLFAIFMQNAYKSSKTQNRTLHYRAEDFVPVLACPSQVDNIHPVSALAGTPIDQVFIGSCTNGRLEDLHAAASVLKGKKTAPFVKLIVTPASRKVYEEALADGTISILAEAGAIITHPGCGLCCGRTGGILTDGERVIATNNRNFLGRMGTSKVEIFLASPATAAASAAAGKITPADIS